ncbi:MAG: PQQ-like beta-propeller repeat protein [Anaerolineales bacterium]|nr:PQQ-like beta-propeller repeat protein [Anaerolineales bacterium]
MNLSKRFRIWLSQRGALALFIVIVVLLGMLQAWLQRPLPRITHILGSSTQHVDVLWFKQEDISNQITTNAGGMAFMMPLAQDALIALDVRSGATIWNIQLPFEQSGVRGMRADQDTIFTVTSIRADAYEATTGELKWSTRLGDGHVSVIPQLDAGVLRVYYGDNLLELDPETGKILVLKPKESIVWVIGNIILHTPTENRLSAFDKQIGGLLWTNRPFYIDEGQEPLDIGNNNLLVGFIRGICALNLRTGEYSWCHPEIDISNVAIDYHSQLGYAMREDLVLLTIDLQTGNVLGETSFLSSQPIDEQIGSVSSITFSNGVVVISFSDSGQTFGLRFSQSSQ